jgi:hypothetical protein
MGVGAATDDTPLADADRVRVEGFLVVFFFVVGDDVRALVRLMTRV